MWFTRILSKLFELIYQPISRAYAKLSMPRDEPAGRLMTLLFAVQFYYVHRHWPHLKEPRSFSEKVVNRMLYDRNPVLTMLSDKLRVRKHVASIIGNEHLIPLLWSGDKPEEIPFDTLPRKYVIKANHGCGFNIIVQDKTRIYPKKVIRQLNKWLHTNFCQDTYLGATWAYKNIRPYVLIETFVDDSGRVPLDYKFFCFSGRAEYVLMTFDRHKDPFEKHFTRDFVPLDLWNGCRQYPGSVERPGNYEQMISLADKLSRGHDFIRVDLYNVGGRIYFGELTCYPAGGLARFIPMTYDFDLGKKWKLPGVRTS
jgi:hypothetical protein